MQLTDKLEMILLEGPKDCGSYEFPVAICRFEEMMTAEEWHTAERFLNWIVANGLKYGHGNLRQRWSEWQGLVAPGEVGQGTVAVPPHEWPHDFLLSEYNIVLLQRDTLIAAAKHAIELIRNAHFIAAWHHLKKVLAGMGVEQV